MSGLNDGKPGQGGGLLIWIRVRLGDCSATILPNQGNWPIGLETIIARVVPGLSPLVPGLSATRNFDKFSPFECYWTAPLACGNAVAIPAAIFRVWYSTNLPK